VLYVLISIEFVSTLVLVPRSIGQTALFVGAIVVALAVCVRMATAGRYRVAEDVLVAAGSS